MLAFLRVDEALLVEHVADAIRSRGVLERLLVARWRRRSGCRAGRARWRRTPPARRTRDRPTRCRRGTWPARRSPAHRSANVTVTVSPSLRPEPGLDGDAVGAELAAGHRRPDRGRTACRCSASKAMNGSASVPSTSAFVTRCSATVRHAGRRAQLRRQLGADARGAVEGTGVDDVRAVVVVRQRAGHRGLRRGGEDHDEGHQRDPDHQRRRGAGRALAGCASRSPGRATPAMPRSLASGAPST